MRFPAWARAGVPGVLAAIVIQHEFVWRELRCQQLFDACGARKMRFAVCQFLVRLTLGAHTQQPMSGAFEYKPKFVDIRVKKPGAETMERAPSERACDHVGCRRPGLHPAPKGRDLEGQFWHFCTAHAADYNKRWNYFAGMTDGQWADYQAREEIGHRPTWTFRSGRLDKHSAAMRGFRAGQSYDPFGMFGDAGAQRTAPAAEPRRRLTRLQTLAFEALALDEGADSATIRAKYAELVKRWHPDSNGGDRGAEEQLQRVIKAYQVLKSAGLV
jgi:hypothetical protein